MKINKVILFILVTGIIYKLIMTSGGNFLFNMDNARDLVDVREVMELKKLRLIGPTSAIEGFYNGPAWYYLLAIPYIISSGNPYSTIILQIILWSIGGFFLLKMVSKFGRFLIIPIGLLWIASDYISLATVYAFNPNPVTLLTPLFIFLIFKYLETNRLIFSILTFFLGGLFFNFEMNFGIFVVPIILTSLIFTKKIHYIKSKVFWMGFLFFIICLLPQLLFDLRHDFIMTKSVVNYIKHNGSQSYNLSTRFQIILGSFFNVFQATLMNHKKITIIILLLFIPVLTKFFKHIKRNDLIIISLVYILIPFTLYIFLPLTVNPWHLGGPSATLILLIGYQLKKLWDFNFWGKIIGVTLTIILIFYSSSNLLKFFLIDFGKPNMDPSSYKNEVAAIDYVYKYANGQNFKVYTYLPSVYDYPYQYLFFWYGQKRYGYIPYEYSYHPNIPQYISNKEKFEGKKENYQGLVFLIKEPDRIKMRRAWEDDFDPLELIKKEVVGPLEVEIRRE